MAKKTKTTKRTGKKGAAAPTTNGNGTIPLKRICQDLGIDPKAARVRLRRVFHAGKGFKFHSLKGRWDLAPAQAKEVRAFLAK